MLYAACDTHIAGPCVLDDNLFTNADANASRNAFIDVYSCSQVEKGEYIRSLFEADICYDEIRFIFIAAHKSLLLICPAPSRSRCRRFLDPHIRPLIGPRPQQPFENEGADHHAEHENPHQD